MSIITSSALFASSDDNYYQISRSLRFSSADNSYLSRTPSVTGNRKTWTLSFWTKRSESSGNLFGVLDASGFNGHYVYWSGDALAVRYNVSGTTSNLWSTIAVFRDFFAWYHVVIAFDTTQAVATDRLKIYVNGTQQTLSATGTWTLNADYPINTTAVHSLGRAGSNENSYLNSYLAECYLIDGQALTPNNFTTTAVTGQLVPKAYTGTYGTNGFKLDFSNSSTVAALGTDTSGNGNTWTVNGISNQNKFTGIIFSNLVTGAGAYVAPIFDRSTAVEGYFRPTFGLTFAGAAQVTAQFSFKIRYYAQVGNEGNWSINGSNSGIPCSYTSTLTQDLSALCPLTITSINSTGGTASEAIYVYYIEVDGAILTDGGVTSDSLVDTPTSYGEDTGVGGEVRGNYATLNPLAKSVFHSLSDGNLQVTGGDSSGELQPYGSTFATIGMSSGKWYWEQTLVYFTSYDIQLGIGNKDTPLDSHPGSTSRSYGFSSGNLKYNSGVATAYTTSWNSNSIIGFAFNADTGSLTLYKNGVSLGVAFSSIPADTYFPIAGIGTYTAETTSIFNFGQRAFAHTPPSGFKALCDTNLPTPAITKPNTVMSTVLYTGTGAVQNITGLAFNPDLVWIKARSAVTDHELTDSVRGVTKSLSSNLSAVEQSDTGGLTAFNNDGFSLGTDTKYNNNAGTYVGWAWDAGSATVINTEGGITSQVRANPNSGFSIVTYTGVGTNNTVGHGLNIAPGMVIVKGLNNGNSWEVRHSSIAAVNTIRLNSTASVVGSSSTWNSTVPSSTVFSVGTSGAVNGISSTYVAYCFAPVSGYSSFSSYIGNSSSSGPFVNLGFRPAVVLIKGSNLTTNWVIFDDQRDGYNVDNDALFPNLTAIESSTDLIDITSNGFKVRSSSSDINYSGVTYIYAAWAATPFQYSRAR